VKDGVVLLGGKAKTPTDDLRAMGDAARVPGVRAMSACRIPAVVLEPFRAIVLRLPDDG
jgi:hypothetical protein